MDEIEVRNPISSLALNSPNLRPLPYKERGVDDAFTLIFLCTQLAKDYEHQ